MRDRKVYPKPPLLKQVRFLSLLLVLGLGFACQPKPSLKDLPKVLKTSWRSYVEHFITPEGRVAIPERQGETISEAQAYGLLRAVWVGDETTFGRLYLWTRHHLSREQTQGDHLLSWHWGRQRNGAFAVLDANAASDGDLDYALALILAARRGWRPPGQNPSYLEEARAVAGAILDKETVTLPSGEVLLTPGNWHETKPPYLVNPSYFSPGTYRLLAQVHGDGRWELLRQSTYQLLDRLARGLGDKPGVGLFPDWCQVNGAGLPGPAPGRDTSFGWEAARLPFRLAQDFLWFKEPQAPRLLGRQFLPLFQREGRRGSLAAVYGYDGTPLASYDSPVLYAGVLAAALAAGDQDFARQMAEKILSFYREEKAQAYFVSEDNYYANNWAWLGLALYAGWVKVF